MKLKRKIFFTMLGVSLAFAGCLTAFGVSMNINMQDKNALSDEQENIPALEYVDSGDYCCADDNSTNNVYDNGAGLNTSPSRQNILSKFIKNTNKIEQTNNANENANNITDFNSADCVNDSIVEAPDNSQKNNSQENTNKDSQPQSEADTNNDLGSQYIESISYIDADGNEKICPCARVITKDDNVLYGNDPKCKGWYVVHQSIETSSVKCEGDVKVIIEKNCTYKVKSLNEESASINVTGKNQFSLFSQVKEAKDNPENGALELVSKCDYYKAGGIGGNAGEEGCNIGIFGCVVKNDWMVRGDSAVIGGGKGKNGHNILIKRAVIKYDKIWNFTDNPAGAVIGGGSDGEGKDIYITDSIIKSYSVGGCGALIGGGDQGCGHNIKVVNTILCGDTKDKLQMEGDGAVIGGGNDGEGYDMTFIDCSMDVKYKGNASGSGAIIGGGDDACGSSIYIEGGSYDLLEYHADGFYSAAACIGGGENAEGHDITITGANIKAKSDIDSAAIGGGQGCKGYNISIENSNVDAQGGEDAAGIGGGDNSMGYGIKIKGGIVTARGGKNGAGIGCGNDAEYKCNREELDNAIIIEGDINGNGTVNAYGGDDAAGIGGGSNPDDDCVLGIHIKSGTINAYGGSGSCGGWETFGGGAGIGGGNNNHGKVTIDGGIVNAHGGSADHGGGAGIGGGKEGFGTIDINDGVINAYGGGYASGIGGGDDDDDSDSRTAVYLHASAQVYAEKGPNGDEAMAVGCGDGGNAPAVWAFPNLIISKFVDSDWYDIDYSAKDNPDKGASDNIVNQISNAKKLRVESSVRIENIEQVQKAYKYDEIKKIKFRAHLGNRFSERLRGQFIGSFHIHASDAFYYCTYEDLQVNNNNDLTFVLRYRIDDPNPGDYPFSIVYSQGFEEYSYSSNLLISVKTISPEMVEPIPDQLEDFKAIEPLPIIKEGKCTLKKDVDYVLRWEHNNEGIGIGKVYVDGINGYAGTIELEFNIVPKSKENRTIVSYYDFETKLSNREYALPYDSKYSSLSNEWCYVYGDVTVDHPITVNGDVHIILVDDSNLNFNCRDSYAFIYGDANSKVSLHYQYLRRGIINTQSCCTQLNEVSFNSVHNVAYCNVHLAGNIDISKITGISFITPKGKFDVDNLSFSSNHFNYSVNIDKYKSLFKEGQNMCKITIGYSGRMIQTFNYINIVKSNTANDQVALADKNTSAKSSVSLDDTNGQMYSEGNDTNIGSFDSSNTVKSFNDCTVKKEGK